MFDKEKYTILLTSFLIYLKDKILFSVSSFSKYKNRLKDFFLFLEVGDLEFGLDSLELFLSARKEGIIPTYHRDEDIKVTFRRFNDFINNREFLMRQLKEHLIILPSYVQTLFDSYLGYCKEKLQNVESTVRIKEKYIGDFLVRYVDRSITLQFYFDPQKIQDVLLEMPNPHNSWPVIRLFLHYCYTEKFTEIDYSNLVPKLKREEKIHSSYTEDELKTVENVIDTTTVLGKRDMVIFLLASRLGIRIGDITNLKLENIDFSNHRINFTQQKTGGEMSLPLIPKIEEALIEYLKVRVRPQEEYIFLSTLAPYKKLKKGAFNTVLTGYFEKASVDITGKKHGPHSLRASLVSSMIRTEVPYEGVREIVGHNSRDALRHYAKIDIPELRKCVLKPLEITGNFKKTINMED